ncbi:MAG TPA: PHB depolymerase family esterase, partial [Fimbriiglobus sp.]|nr:PHB depolymerase family esterase [Fimbriiglobus sp.]
MEFVAVTVAGVGRRYLLAGTSSAVGQPVVIVLHGTGGTAAWADDETGWSAVAAREGFALAIPEGLPPDPHKPPKFLTNPQRWTEGTEDVEFLSTVIADVLRRASGDPRRVYLTGFSNGAAMAFRFAAERAELLAAVAPVAGYCEVPDPKPSRPVPTLTVIGTADPLVPLRGGPVRLPWGGRLVDRPPVAESLERWAKALGCSPVPEVV